MNKLNWAQEKVYGLVHNKNKSLQEISNESGCDLDYLKDLYYIANYYKQKQVKWEDQEKNKRKD